MEIKKVLRMKEGTGLDSYANNSLVQKSMFAKASPMLEESIKKVYHALQPECFMMADLGCSSGPNALLAATNVVDMIDETCRSLNRKAPQIGVFLNDLPGNDFNNLFKLISSFYERVEKEKGKDFGPCYVSGTPGSYYGRIFPDQFLHFVHSSCSVHWISQVPKGLVGEDGRALLNKGNICIAKTTPPEVVKAYYEQFKKDFTLFLSSRAREMVPGGCMFLTFGGSIKANDPGLAVGLLGSTLHDMVLEGIIEEEKLDSFDIPMYTPTIEEVVELIKGEGSFELEKCESFTVDWSFDTTRDLDKQAEVVAGKIRAALEPLLESCFGKANMDHLFLKYRMRAKECMAAKKCEHYNIAVSLTKK